jgi:hypothetical protein
LLLALASTVILSSEPHDTHDHTSLSDDYRAFRPSRDSTLRWLYFLNHYLDCEVMTVEFNKTSYPLLHNGKLNMFLRQRTRDEKTDELLEMFSIRCVLMVGSNTSTVALRIVGGDEKGTQCLGV